MYAAVLYVVPLIVGCVEKPRNINVIFSSIRKRREITTLCNLNLAYSTGYALKSHKTPGHILMISRSLAIVVIVKVLVLSRTDGYYFTYNYGQQC